MTKVERLEKQLAELAQEIYELGERRIEPTWPWVLVRLAPKEQIRNGIVLPDSYGSQSQNKPLFEGIVLATWKPHFSKWRKPNEAYEDHLVWRESEFEVGDRVLFPSFAGLPVNFLDETNYRLVREWTFDELGGVFGKVSYDGDVKIKRELERTFEGLQSVTMSGK